MFRHPAARSQLSVAFESLLFLCFSMLLIFILTFTEVLLPLRLSHIEYCTVECVAGSAVRFLTLNACERSATSSGHFTALRRSSDTSLPRSFINSEQFCTPSPQRTGEQTSNARGIHTGRRYIESQRQRCCSIAAVLSRVYSVDCKQKYITKILVWQGIYSVVTPRIF